MPRLKKTAAQKAAEAKVDFKRRLDLEFKKHFAAGMAEKGFKLREVESLVELSPSTFRRRREVPEELTLREVRIIAQEFGMTAEQVAAFVGVS